MIETVKIKEKGRKFAPFLKPGGDNGLEERNSAARLTGYGTTE